MQFNSQRRAAMGIIKAAINSASTMAADQYKEYFYCDALPGNIIMKRAFKYTSERSANEGSDDVISDGSVIAVADGEFAIVVSNGKVLSEYKEPGEHIFVSGVTSTVFHGGNLSSLGKEFGRRFSFGGDTAGVVQRVYYFNTKEMPGEAFSGGNIPFRVVDENTGLDMDCTVAVSGYYTYRVANPMIIYKQMIGNIEHVYTSEYLLKIMSAEVRAKILSTFGEITGLGLRPSKIAERMPEIEETARAAINKKLYDTRGVELVSFGITGFRITSKEAAVIKDFQKIEVLTDPAMADAARAAAGNQAITNAVSNGAGARLGVATVNAMTGSGGNTKGAEPVKQAPKFCTECGAKLEGGKFCRECGHPV